jgi:hypothetical protein
MVDIIEASEAAVAFLKKVIPAAESIDLEEVEIVEAPGGLENWQLTLSYVNKTDEPKVVTDIAGTMAAMLGGPRAGTKYLPKHYKSFLVDGTSGQVRSMKIRKA